MSTRYTASATTIGGRNGHVDSADGLIHLDLTVDRALGGPGKPGASNPEQLFASGYSACFGSAIDFIAKQAKVHLDEIKVTAEVTLTAGDDGFNLATVLRAALKGVDRAEAEKLVQQAHQVCPYSKATRGNMPVELVVA